MKWTKGKPTKCGLYWLACYAGHGEFQAVLSHVYWDHLASEKKQEDYPKPNKGGVGYGGEALTYLIEYDEKHPKSLHFVGRGGDPREPEYLEDSWVEGYIAIEKPDASVFE